MSPYYFGPIAYAVYVANLGKFASGQLPWDMLPDQVKHAWEEAATAAATAAIEQHTNDLLAARDARVEK